jgi:hypothetical protein
VSPYPEAVSWYFWPGAASIVFVYVLPVVLAGGYTLRFLSRALLASRQARDARRTADAESQMLDEGDTILRGRAEVDDADGAVRVMVEQEGSEAESSGSWTVTWTEKRRHVTVAPFYVVHASGERVRVEPGNETHLAADLVATERIDRSLRRRIARIAEGQEVWITGELAKGRDPHAAGGYRGASGWVMRPSRDGTMRVSTELPEAALLRERKRARFWTVVFALLFVAMMGSHLEYHALLFSGRQVLATVADKRVMSNDDSESYELRFRAGGGASTIEDTLLVSSATFDAWAPPNPFPAFAAFGPLPCIEPGDAPRALASPTLVALGVWLVLAITAANPRRRQWHEGARVDESESGRL